LNKKVTISSLSIGYDNKPIIENINLSSESNKLITIFGRNGQGKSTLLKTISGLLPSLNGQFKYGDIDVLEISELERAKILSIVSTSQTNIGGIIVKDFIAFGRFPYTNWLGINKKEDLDEITRAIKLCKIQELSDRFYNELSDGEKQKVNIARAIAQNTPLIILDEPTVHLDLINKIEVFKLLKELVDKHSKTIIISTHQIEYALQVCNEVWLINNNKVESLYISDLINSDKLSEMFNDDLISFDKASLSFKFIN
jgi:iron complex transport system ATP-binding protein